MAFTFDSNLSEEQQQRLAKFGGSRCVDVHCHVLPGLDDGPTSIDEAVDLCRALVRDGITTVVATPHQLGRYDRLNSASVVRQRLSELSQELHEREIPVDILPGGDVRIDERLPMLLDADEVCTVADAGHHLLLELPHELFVDPLPMISLLRKRRVQAIVTHPERHPYLHGSAELVRGWASHGALIQVTAGSLVGDFGKSAFDYAWRLVNSGLVSLVATDAHDTSWRPPRLSAAINLLTQEIGIESTRQLCFENPLRVVEGDHLGKF